MNKCKGLMLATAAAALFASGASLAVEHETAKVECKGSNACKEKGACKSAKNECGGKNECAGHVYWSKDEADCTDKGGTVHKP